MLKVTLVATLMLVATAYAEPLVATVLLTPDPAFLSQNVTGILTITQEKANGQAVITGTIEGLNPKSKHGFHVHALGNIANGCKSTGSHFNPEKVNHGAPDASARHVGDLGNIEANENGVAHINITDSIVSLSGKNNIIGRAIVVHSLPDDLGKGKDKTSLETGNAGDRWACGVIGIL